MASLHLNVFVRKFICAVGLYPFVVLMPIIKMLFPSTGFNIHLIQPGQGILCIPIRRLQHICGCMLCVAHHMIDGFFHWTGAASPLESFSVELQFGRLPDTCIYLAVPSMSRKGCFRMVVTNQRGPSDYVWRIAYAIRRSIQLHCS